MTDREKVKDAFSNCIAEPKCKDCPWEQCESLTEKRIRIPASLCHDVMEMLIDAPTIVPNNAMPTIGGWISVKDRLPTESGQYLVYIRHWQCDGYTEVCGFDADKKEFGNIDMDYAYDNDGWYSINDVTHWQELPEPPKEGMTNG